MNELQPTHLAVVCKACGGDPMQSEKCKSCGGAGVGLTSLDGFLVWSEPIDDFHLAFRSARRITNLVLNMMLLGCFLLSVATFVWQASRLSRLDVLLTPEFWSAGLWFVTLFWFGLLAGCFLIFRFFEYGTEAKTLPNWGKTKTQRAAFEATASERANYRFEIAPFFTPEAMKIVDDSYAIAKSMQKVSITPTMLFASALASHVGGLFLFRIGAAFNDLKASLSKLLLAEPSGVPPILLSRESKQTLALAYARAREQNRKHVGAMEIFVESFRACPDIQLLFQQKGFPPEYVLRVAEWISMEDRMHEDHARFLALAALKPASVMNRAMTARQTPLLDRLSEDLTLAARQGYLAPVVGREKEMEELFRAIESGSKSVVLVGEPGVGKTAIVEELARRMVEEDVPPQLFDRRLVSVDLSQIIAAGDPSLAPERLMAMFHEVGSSGNIILVMQNAEALAGGAGSGPMDLADIVSNQLDRGYLLAMLTTTPRAWTEHLERRNLGSKLIKVTVAPSSPEQTLRILMAKSGMIEYQQKVFFSYAALEKATELSLRYLHEKAAPENALLVLRESAVFARTSREEHTAVTADDVAKVVHDKTDIPVERMTVAEANKLLTLEDQLHARVVGQHEAVTAAAQALRRARAEVREGKRPIANLLFLGPTGVGKTELAKALAAEYFGSEAAMVRLDMSEYQDRSSIDRMIGAPGDERGGLLTEAIRKNPFSLVLLDELEKADPNILSLFLQVMEDGRLTDGVGRTIDCTNIVLIATSNAGSPYIQSEIAAGTPIEQIRTGLLERELKGIFRPEFLNRFDAMIVFKPLTMDEVTQVAWHMLNGIAKQLETKGLKFRAEDQAVEELARAGYDPQFGARPLRRVIQDRVENALADLLLRGEIARTSTIVLTAGGTLSVEGPSRIGS